MSEETEQLRALASQFEAQQFAPWARGQLSGMELGDQRRQERLIELLSCMAQRPGGSLPQQCEQSAPLKAAYRLLECPELVASQISASAAAATVEMLQQRAIKEVLLAVQDTTTLNFTTHEALEGRGPICNHSKTQGFHAHSTLLVGEEGVVHGLLDCEVYARDAASQRARRSGERNRQSAAQKESQRWLQSARQSAQLCSVLEQVPAIVSVADREADMYEMLVQARELHQQHKGRFHLLVRAQHDRMLEGLGQRLWQHLLEQPAQEQWEVELPAPKGLHGRQQRHLAAVWQKVSLAVPAHQRKYQGAQQAVEVHVIMVREPCAPKGVEALEWVLLTTWPVHDAQEARRVVGWYAKRWQIEVLHRVWKSGCKVEQRRLRSARAAQVMILLDLLTAVMLLGLVSSSRLTPQASSAGWLTPLQVQVLRQRFGNPKTGTAGMPLSLAQAVRWIAQLGGHRGAPSSPPPGAESLWLGITRLQDMTLGWQLALQQQNVGKR